MKNQAIHFVPGSIALMGSGETTPHGGQVFDRLARELPRPVKVRLLGTPAGFELNSDQVIGRVAHYLGTRLQNFQPDVAVVSARRRDGAAGTESQQTAESIFGADLIFMGPGSPTYAARQLRGTLTWDALQAAQRCGCALALASAATVSVSALALPVYEIFKAGEDPRWTAGLDLFSAYGLSLVVIPHWNNQEGGAALDTSRCFIGEERFRFLEQQLPAGITVLGLDEHTSVIFDLANGNAAVFGRDQIHIRKNGVEKTYRRGDVFSLNEMGEFRLPQDWREGVPEAIWDRMAELRTKAASEHAEIPSEEVFELMDRRRRAREQRDWAESDRLRDAIAAKGWRVVDTPDGQNWNRPDGEINPVLKC